MLTPSVLMCVGMMVMVAEGQRVMRMGDRDIPACASSNSVYRRSSRQCPPRAVCADVWNTVRDWYNGTRCREYRVMINCRCPGNQDCPIDNPNHVLYANDKQSQYLCQPACELEACRTGFRAAKEMVSSANRRRSYRYYRINCRCGNHHVPLSSRGRGGRLNRATMYGGIRVDRPNRLVYTRFKCVRYLQPNNDPCGPRQ